MFGGTPWPEGAQLELRACPSASVPYTQGSRPAVSLRISRNRAWFRAGPYQCLP